MKEISVKDWEDTGLLKGVSGDKKEMLVLTLNELAKFLFDLEISTDLNDNAISLQTWLFPLVRRVYDATDYKYEMNVREVYNYCLSQLEDDLSNVNCHITVLASIKGVDCEYEVIALLSEEIANGLENGRYM